MTTGRRVEGTMMPWVARYGPHGLLVGTGEGRAAALADAIGRFGLAGLVETVPAAETVTLIFTDAASCDEAHTRLTDQSGPHLLGDRDPTALVEAREHSDATSTLTIPCRFDGPDLDAVARECRMAVSEVVALLTGARLEVAFCGFSPGFAYLVGVPEQLHLPRRDTSRARVPAGSVAIAAGYAAVYPAASPGGWHLLGTTDVEIWAPARVPPALLVPGRSVRFVEADGY